MDNAPPTTTQAPAVEPTWAEIHPSEPTWTDVHGDQAMTWEQVQEARSRQEGGDARFAS